jgi:hypothetical protein
MKGMAVHLQVWLASLLFFGANVNILRAILSNYIPVGSSELKKKTV